MLGFIKSLEEYMAMTLDELLKKADAIEKEKANLIKELVAQRDLIISKLDALGYSEKKETRGRKKKEQKATA